MDSEENVRQDIEAYLNGDLPMDNNVFSSLFIDTEERFPNFEPHPNTDERAHVDRRPTFIREADTQAAQISHGIDVDRSHNQLRTVVYTPRHVENPLDANQASNGYQYCCLAFEGLRKIVARTQPALTRILLDTAVAETQLNGLRHPSASPTGGPLKAVLEAVNQLIQMASNGVRPAAQIPFINENGGPGSNVFHPREISEPRIAEPDEPNGEYMDNRLRRRETLPVAIPLKKDADRGPSPLSQLLKERIPMFVGTAQVQLRVAVQPKKFWKHRSLSCLANNVCPELQGEGDGQRHHVTIEWSTETNYETPYLLVCIQLLDCEGNPNQSKILLPHDARIRSKRSLEPAENQVKKPKLSNKKRLKLKDIEIPENCGFDEHDRLILQPVSEADSRRHKMELRVKMCNLYKSKEESVSDEEDTLMEHDSYDDSIKHQISKLCKLRIWLCQETRDGQLQCVSQAIDTNLIEESKGTEELLIDPSSVSPRELCECGNEVIRVQLSTDSEKEGFVIKLNDESLQPHRFRGVQKKSIQLNSIPKSQAGTDSLHLEISKKSVRETIELGGDPRRYLAEKLLLNTHLHYVQFSENPHEHAMPAQ